MYRDTRCLYAYQKDQAQQANVCQSIKRSVHVRVMPLYFSLALSVGLIAVIPGRASAADSQDITPTSPSSSGGPATLNDLLGENSSGDTGNSANGANTTSTPANSAATAPAAASKAASSAATTGAKDTADASEPSSKASTTATTGPATASASEPTPVAKTVADDAGKHHASSNRLLSEIIVTAEKRAENIEDVPITVQAFSAGVLDAKGVVTAKDLPAITPGLNYAEFVGYSVIYLRGIGTSAFLTADPSVASYVDGVYLPFASGLASDFGSIDRIEVLKGPQGTLFGRNAVGGAIATYTKDPKISQWSLDGTASYAKFGDANTKASVNIPIGNTLAVSLSGLYHKNQFFYRGTAGGVPYGSEASRGFRIKALWRPFDDLDILGAYAYNSFNGYGTDVTPNVNPSLLGTLLGAKAQTSYVANLNEAGLSFRSSLAYGHIAYHPGPLDIKLLTSYQRTGNAQLFDFDGSSAKIAEFNAPTEDGQGANTFTSELQFVSNQDSPYASWWKWIVGGYYFNSQAGFNKPAYLYLDVLDPAQSVTQTVRSLLPAGLQSLIGQVPNGEIGFTSGVGTHSLAAYLQTTVDFTDWLSLTLGGRYTDERRVANLSGTYLGQTNGTFAPLIIRPHQQHTTIVFSPKVSLQLKPADGLLFYASYQTADKSGTYNAVQIYTPTVKYVPPETIKAYEVGAKMELFDRQLTLNTAAWYYIQKNLQIQFVSLLAGGAVTFETAGGAHSKGAEFDLTWSVLPDYIDGLALTAGGSYVDAKYTSYNNASGFDPTTGVQIVGQNFKGHRPAQSPNFTGNIGINKVTDIPEWDGSIEAAADIYYTSGFYWDAQNTSRSRQAAYMTLNMRASYLYKPKNLRITAYVNNVLDRRYNTEQFTTDFGVLQYQALPRVFGMRMEVHFD